MTAPRHDVANGSSFRNSWRWSGVLTVLTVALLAVLPSMTAAQTLPADADNFPGVAIGALPYTALTNTEGATVEAGEPLQPNSGPTLWFHFTAPTNGAVGVELQQDGIAGGYVTVYTGSNLTGLTMVADGSTSSVGPWAAVFRAQAGITYYLQVASNQFTPPYAAKLTLRLQAGTPPPNDIFPGQTITSLPFTDTVDTTFATLDEGEPSLLGNTVWYSFTGPPGGAAMQADSLGTTLRGADFTIEDASSLEIPGGANRGATISCGTARVTVFYVGPGETLWFAVGSQGFPGPRGVLHFTLQQVDASTVALCPGDQPPFNYDVVKEVVVPLVGDDGRTHYVTMSQDTAGVVRVRLSLFNFSSGSYNVVIRERADCDDSGGLRGQLRPPLELGSDSSSHLVLTFWNTDLISLTAGAPNSIYDADGASLAVYRPGSGGSGLRAACAILAGPPGAPGTGSGTRAVGGSDLPWSPLAAALGVALLTTSAVVGAAVRRRST